MEAPTINLWNLQVQAFNLSIDDRFTIANMAIEARMETGYFPSFTSPLTTSLIAQKHFEPVEADEDAIYTQTLHLSLAMLSPLALPHLPENIRSAHQLHHIFLDQVVIGSCTNGRYQI